MMLLIFINFAAISDGKCELEYWSHLPISVVVLTVVMLSTGAS